MKIILAFIISLFAIKCFAQINFENYLIKEVGSISIPKSLELQAGKYKEYAEGVQSNASKKFKYEISDQRIVFQNKQVNQYDKDALNEYTRIIIETKIGEYGDYEKLTTKLKLSKSALVELNNQMKKSFEEMLNKMGSKLIKWYVIQLVLVNGRTALKIYYTRQLNENKPYVSVTIYQFQNNDRIYFLTLSCREKDAAQWKQPFQTVLNSFTISNVRYANRVSLTAKFSIASLEKFLNLPLESVNRKLEEKGYKKFWSEKTMPLLDTITTISYHAQNEKYFVNAWFGKGICYHIDWTTSDKKEYDDIVGELKNFNYNYDEKTTNIYKNNNLNFSTYFNDKNLNNLRLSNGASTKFTIIIENTLLLY